MGNVFDQPGGWIILLVGSLVLVGWVTWLLVSTRHVVADEHADLAAFARRDRSIGGLGRVAFFLGLAVLSLLFSGPARGAAAGVITALVLWGLERWWPQPSGTVRTALVRRRTWSEVVTRSGLWLTGLAVALAVGSLAWAAFHHAAGGAPSAAVLLVVVAVVVGLGVADVLRRPSVAGLEEASDALLRRGSADRMLRVVGVSAAVVAGVFFDQARVGASAAGRAAGVADTGWPMQVSGAATLLLIIALLGIGRVRIPSPRRAASAAATGRR